MAAFSHNGEPGSALDAELRWNDIRHREGYAAGFKAGREAGMREAAELCEDGIRDGPLSPAERYRAGFIRDAILSAIEGAK